MEDPTQGVPEFDDELSLLVEITYEGGEQVYLVYEGVQALIPLRVPELGLVSEFRTVRV